MTYAFLRIRAIAIASMAVAAMASSALIAAAKPIRLVAFGDSLTAGFGLARSDGFAAKLQAALRKQGHDIEVVDGGVSGDTTTGGLARLDWTLGEGTQAVILELGANDMLRGVDPKIPEANLDKMLAKLKAKHIAVLLAGMRAQPGLGPEYRNAFDPIYERLAKKYGIELYPFFTAGIMGDASQHLADGLHPNVRGVDTIVAGILPAVDRLLKNVEAKN